MYTFSRACMHSHSHACTARRYVPWGLVFMWIFRLLGALALGPHMLWYGKGVRAKWAAFIAESEAFASGDKQTRQQMLDKYRQECEEQISEAVQTEVHGTLPPPEVLKTERALAKKYMTVMVKPEPTSAKLRFRHRPNRKRSVAYPVGAKPVAAGGRAAPAPAAPAPAAAVALGDGDAVVC